jgi:hypothetical protein
MKIKREGITLHKCLNGWAFRLGTETFTARHDTDNDGYGWIVTGHYHKAKHGYLETLSHCVVWAGHHLKYCGGGCDSTWNPFAILKGKI